MEIMTIIVSPDNFLEWQDDRKLDRYRKIVAWHERNAELAPEKVPYSWGAYQIVSQVDPSPVVHVLVAVYRVESVREFDSLMLNDPLRHVSKYSTILLDKLEGDFDVDTARYNSMLARITEGRTEADLKEVARVRAHYASAPDFVGKFEFQEPPMPLRSYFSQPGLESSDLEFLIQGMNLEEDHGWDDLTKVIHYEKVLWWHHYIAKMISEGRVSHTWSTHDFCNIGAFSNRSASAAVIYRAKDLIDFAEVYRQDPLRTRARFWSVALKPISLQRQQDIDCLQNHRIS
jgi:hypothetical protein